MKLTHKSLMNLGQLLGYSGIFERGLCQGYSVMLALAILSKDSLSFYARLQLIETYHHDFNALVQEINQTREKVKTYGENSLNKKERLLLEIPAFFEGVAVYLRPYEASFFDNQYIAQSNLKKIYPLVHSKAMEGTNISLVLENEWALSREKLTSWLTDLGHVLSKAGSPVPIILTNSNHSICVHYHPQKKCWIFSDTNDFADYLKTRTYYRELTTLELTQSIFNSFDDKGHGHTLFSTQGLAIHPNLSFKKAINDFNLKHTLRKENAHRYNHVNTKLLYLACRRNHLEKVKELLHDGTPVNQRTNKGLSPLYIACQEGHINIVETLLKHGARVNQAGKMGAPPLLVACLNGHIKIVSTLLKHGADVHQAINNGSTLLYIACLKGDINVVNALLEHGAHVNQANNNGDTPLYIASIKGDINIVNALLEHGAHVNQANNDGDTPLREALSLGHFDIAKKLLEYGAKNYCKQIYSFFNKNVSGKTLAAATATIGTAAGIYYMTAP